MFALLSVPELKQIPRVFRPIKTSLNFAQGTNPAPARLNGSSDS
jgi:hypothetical protein